jgi:two-component system, cell cycle response regulator CpdR
MDGTLWVEMKQSWRRLLPETLMREFRTPQSQHEAGESPPLALSNRDACAHTNGEQATILLVDDNELVLDVMAEVLADSGHQVITCRDSEACLHALQRIDQRVVLVTEMLLPGGSGRALADEFRRRRPGNPIVFVTGLPTDPLEPLRQDEEVLLKPFRVHELLSAIAQACIKI